MHEPDISNGGGRQAGRLGWNLLQPEIYSWQWLLLPEKIKTSTRCILGKQLNVPGFGTNGKRDLLCCWLAKMAKMAEMTNVGCSVAAAIRHAVPLPPVSAIYFSFQIQHPHTARAEGWGQAEQQSARLTITPKSHLLPSPSLLPSHFP